MRKRCAMCTVLAVELMDRGSPLIVTEHCCNDALCKLRKIDLPNTMRIRRRLNARASHSTRSLPESHYGNEMSALKIRQCRDATPLFPTPCSSHCKHPPEPPPDNSLIDELTQ